MPLCFGASASVRASTKIQLARWPGRRPDLLAVDHPLVAVELGAAPEVAEVGAGVRLGVALAPDVLAGEDAREEVLLLLVGAPLRGCVLPTIWMPNTSLPTPAGTPALVNSSARITCSSAVRPAPPYSFGQRAASSRFVVERAPPLEREVVDLVAVERADALPAGGQVLGEERLDLLAVGLGFGGVGRLHRAEGSPSVRLRRTGRTAAADSRPRRRRRAGPRRGRRARSSVPRGNSRRADDRARPGRRRRTASPKPRATEPATTARRRSSSAPPTPRARPTSSPVRSIVSAGRPRRPAAGDRRRSPCPTPRPRGSPRPPHTHGRPSGSTMTWPMWPALPAAPSSSRPSSTMPPPTPVDTTMARKSRSPAAAPRQPSPSASALASLSTTVGRPTRSRTRRAQREVAPAGDVQRRHRLAARRHRPAAADAAHDRRDGRRRPRHAKRRRRRSPPTAREQLAVGVGAGGRHARRRRSTVAVHGRPAPAASLVPPMSTASDDPSTSGTEPYSAATAVRSRRRGLTLAVTVRPVRGRPGQERTPRGHTRDGGSPRAAPQETRTEPFADVFGAIARQHRAGHPGQARGDRARARCAWSPRATC